MLSRFPSFDAFSTISSSSLEEYVVSAMKSLSTRKSIPNDVNEVAVSLKAAVHFLEVFVRPLTKKLYDRAARAAVRKSVTRSGKV
jgi:mannose/fructose/N-acetylgalactosamine-specific phosphotransferase system component IIC